MGIGSRMRQCLYSLLENIDNTGIRKVHISKFNGQTIVVDFSNISFRFLYRINNMIDFICEWINLVAKFQKQGIDLIVVFDGRPIKEKNVVIEQRKNYREKLCKKIDNIIESLDFSEEYLETIQHLSKKTRKLKPIHINEAKKLFDTLGVMYFHIENKEADVIFKYLLDKNIAQSCFSGDMDILAYGCKIILQDLDFRNDLITEINYEQLLSYLELTNEQFLMSLILSGTDWNNSLKKSSFTNNIALIKQYGTIQNVIEHLDEINTNRTENNNIEIPARFDWQFSLQIYQEEINSDIKKLIAARQEEHIKRIKLIKSQKGFDHILEYISYIYNNCEYKYVLKLMEFMNWKYSYSISKKDFEKNIKREYTSAIPTNNKEPKKLCKG